MGYDPNDPNQGSQAPGYEGDPYQGGLSLDALIKSRPGIAPWLAAHRGGQNLSPAEESQLFGLVQQSGIDTQMLELGNDGTFNAGTGHTLRDIAYGSLLAFGPIAAAWAAPILAGAATTAAGASASAVGPSTAANIAATSAAAGSAPASLGAIGGTAAAAAGGLSYGDLLKYGLPVAGNLINGVIQAKASGAASDAQQKYLEEALAYQKESDEYARSTDASRYADSRGDLAAALAKEQTRYGDYQGRIAPFIANGTSSNDRMAALLGLPARAPGAGSGGSSGTPASQGVPLTADITSRLADNYKTLGVTPTGPGTGPTDIAYMAQKVAETGGWTPDNEKYWLGPTGRVAQELAKAGVSRAAAPAAASPPAPITTQPQARSTDLSAASAPATVQMRAPDGSVKAVPADQVDHYLQLGATHVQGAA